MQLFFNSDISPDTSLFYFDKNESRHIIKVLRKKEQDVLSITNGQGDLFHAEILEANEKKCVVSIISHELKTKERDYYLHVVIAPTKSNDRFEWFLEKSTEIGVDEITPLICDNSERKVINKDRFNKVIISAMKQSLKFHLPLLNDALNFSDYMNHKLVGHELIAHCEQNKKQKLHLELLKNNRITIFIGPEGDFSMKEIESALRHKFIPVSLGLSRLRTETAGVVVCNTVSVLKSLQK